MLLFGDKKEIIQEKVLQKSNLFKDQTCLGTNQGVIQKEKSKSYLNTNKTRADAAHTQVFQVLVASLT